MQITEIRVLRGPNIWTHLTALEVTLRPHEKSSTIKNQELCEKIYASYGVKVDCSSPNILASSFLQLLVALHNYVGSPVDFQYLDASLKENVFRAIIHYREEKISLKLLAIAEKLLSCLQVKEDYEPSVELAEIKETFDNIMLGPSTRLIINAAEKLNIPYRRLNEGSLVQLGWGKKQKRILAAETSQTSLISERIAQDKWITKELLYMAGLPVPFGKVAESFEESIEIIKKTGFPVVVKPLEGNQGRGVSTNITNYDELNAAFLIAHREQEISDEVLIEQHVEGHDYRLLVVNKKLIAAARREPPYVLGDGKNTVQALIDQENKDPRRKKDHNGYLTTISVDEIVLACLKKQGYALDSIPAPQEKVLLRFNANLSNGGFAVDVTDTVHSEIANLAIQVAQVIGFDITGIDLVCTDITQSLDCQKSIGIIEVNAAPGLRMHVDAEKRDHHGIGKAIMDSLFGKDDGRIPVIAITGTNGKTTTTRLIDHCLKMAGKTVGMTCTHGVYVGENTIDTGDCSGPKSARRVLLHPDVDVAVFETARGSILREGLGFDYCSVAVVTNIGQGDHLGLNHINTPQDMQRVKQLIVTCVSHEGTAVLNADDPLVAGMAEHCPGHVIYFSLQGVANLTSLNTQGRRIYLHHNTTIVMEDQHGTTHMVNVVDIPLTQNGRIMVQIQNIMAAMGALWALNYDPSFIISALCTFSPHVDKLPGRFNFFQYNKATVLADYGHNPDAIRSIMEVVQTFPARHRFLVTSAPGDRPDETIIKQMRILGSIFDTAILFQDECQRGRAVGEIFPLMRKGLEQGGKTQAFQEIHDEIEAIAHTLEQLQENDFCLILIDRENEVLDYLKTRTTSLALLA